jgi:hypothetical protein
MVGARVLDLAPTIIPAGWVRVRVRVRVRVSVRVRVRVRVRVSGCQPHLVAADTFNLSAICHRSPPQLQARVKTEQM